MLKPTVNKKWLILASGLLWSVAGILLLRIAWRWLLYFSALHAFLIILIGLFAGILINKFGFSLLAEKNAKRIFAYQDKVCLFAFQRWQMYFLIIFMMSLGFFLRSYPFLPDYLMATGYIGIGSALVISSFIYYKVLGKKNEANE